MSTHVPCYYNGQTCKDLDHHCLGHWRSLVSIQPVALIMLFSDLGAILVGIVDDAL